MPPVANVDVVLALVKRLAVVTGDPRPALFLAAMGVLPNGTVDLAAVDGDIPTVTSPLPLL